MGRGGRRLADAAAVHLPDRLRNGLALATLKAHARALGLDVRDDPDDPALMAWLRGRSNDDARPKLAARDALLPSRFRGKDMRTMSAPRVLLTTLSVRTSAKGASTVGFLGKSRVVAFEGEADRFGNPTWDIFVAEPEPREGTPGARQGLSERDADNGRTEAPPNAGARSGDFHRAPRAESAAARKERVSAEVASGYGVERDEDLNDAIPF